MTDPIQRWKALNVSIYRQADGGEVEWLTPDGHPSAEVTVVLAADAEAHEAAAVAAAVDAARWEWCKVEAMDQRREPHAGSCRIFYFERRCSCGAELDAYRQGQRDERAASHAALLPLAAEMVRYCPEDHDADAIEAALRAWALRIKAVIDAAPQDDSRYTTVHGGVQVPDTAAPQEPKHTLVDVSDWNCPEDAVYDAAPQDGGKGGAGVMQCGVCKRELVWLGVELDGSRTRLHHRDDLTPHCAVTEVESNWRDEDMGV